MPRNFKLIGTFLISFAASLGLSAQEAVKFKDVLLDGKPAKLNIITGEVTLIKLEDQIPETKADSLNIKPIIIANTPVKSNSDVSKIVTDDDADFYVVQEGDNLFRISVSYNTSLTILKEANNLETTLIKKGQKLRVRNFDQYKSEPTLWIVKKGDNLYRIALETGLTVDAIKSLNGLTNDKIYIGQELRLK
ncbi:MAG: LysM peptidoglycan-binding domain-containing protein [Winogradskyella sp.]|nr:LysM peptidoglycan-binding domain-containing protein [Winogradskyella sp.]